MCGYILRGEARRGQGWLAAKPPVVPIVLLGEGDHQLFSRQKIVDFLGQRSPADLPWQESKVEIPDPSD